MSNLGLYQTVVTVMKRLGGPKVAIPLVLGGVGAIGYGVRTVQDRIVGSRVGDTGGQTVAGTYMVKVPGESGGETFRPGDELRVMESDGEAVLVERLGDEESPYVVPSDMLHSSSEQEPGNQKERDQ